MVAQSSKESRRAFPLRRLIQAGLLGVFASAAVNLLMRAVLFAVLPLPADFPPLQPVPITLFTMIGTALAAVVFAVVVRISGAPIRVFRILSLVALVLSILPNVSLMINLASAPFPGGSALAFGVLILFHIAAALVSVGILTTWGQKR